MKPKINQITILDGFTVNPGDLSWEQLEGLGHLKVYDRTSPEQTAWRAADADIVLTNKVVLDRKILESLPRLKYVGVLATGYNVVDIDAAAERGVVVTNIPAYSSDSVAQMTFAHILNITNRVAHYAEMNKNGRWTENPDFCYWDTPLPELAGKVLGIIGLGHIGSKVARIARCFGMDVFALTSKESASLPEGIQKTTLDGLLAISDVLTLHCPLNDESYRMFDKTAFDKMKDGAIFVNTARGGVMDENAVAQALRSGKLRYAAIDVLEQEPMAQGCVLCGLENCIVTPHIAWASTEARTRLIQVATDNVRAFISGKPQNVVSS